MTQDGWSASGWSVRTSAKATPTFAFSSYEAGERWRFEVDVEFKGSEGGAVLAGVVFGVGPRGGRSLIALRPEGLVQFVDLDETGRPTFEDLGPFEYAPDRAHKVRVESDGENVSVAIDGKPVGARPMTGEECAGLLGYFQQQARAVFSNARVFE